MKKKKISRCRRKKEIRARSWFSNGVGLMSLGRKKDDIMDTYTEDRVSCSVMSTYVCGRGGEKCCVSDQASGILFIFLDLETFNYRTSLATVQLKVEPWPGAALFTTLMSESVCSHGVVDFYKSDTFWI